MWRLRWSGSATVDVDSQISALLGALTDDLRVWHDLANRFTVDLFCGLFMEQANEGLTLKPETMTLAGQRGLVLGLDIYSPDEP